MGIFSWFCFAIWHFIRNLVTQSAPTSKPILFLSISTIVLPFKLMFSYVFFSSSSSIPFILSLYIHILFVLHQLPFFLGDSYVVSSCLCVFFSMCFILLKHIYLSFHFTSPCYICSLSPSPLSPLRLLSLSLSVSLTLSKPPPHYHTSPSLYYHPNPVPSF